MEAPMIHSRTTLIFRLSALICIVSLVLPMAATAAETSKEILIAERSGKRGAPRVERQDKMLKIELCHDTCTYFTAHKVQSEDEVWDLIFLREAYFDNEMTSRSFRARHQAHTSFVLAEYVRKCSSYPQDATRARCIIKYLSGHNGVSYFLVRYDAKDRCEASGDLTDPTARPGKPKCTPMKN